MRKHILFVSLLMTLVISINSQSVVSESVKPTCDVYNNIKVGLTITHLFAALGKNVTLTKQELKKEHNHFWIDKWITAYTYREMVWRIEYKGLRLPCRYLYDQSANLQRHLSDDATILVIYDVSNGTTSVTNLDMWNQILLSTKLKQ